MDPPYFGIAKCNGNVRGQPCRGYTTSLAVEGIQIVEIVTYCHVDTTFGVRNGLFGVIVEN